MYKYYLILRGRSIGTQPEGYVGWTDYTERRAVPEIARMAWGELYYDRELTEKEVRDYDLHSCGRVQAVEYMDVYRKDGVEMREVHGLAIGEDGGLTVQSVRSMYI